MGTPRVIRQVVFDTNTVVSALLFSHGHLAWLREAWRTQRLVPLVSKQTTAELLRVLAYPKFQLNQSEREEVLADYLPFAEVVPLPDDPPDLLACRDPFDQPFIQLAAVAEADALVSGDKDILIMKEHLPFVVLTPTELAKAIE